MAEIDAGVGLRARVPPGRHVVAGRIEEGAKPHLALGRHFLVLALLRAARWSAEL
jgi:hypothetical protein